MPGAGLKVLVFIMKCQEPFKYYKNTSREHLRHALQTGVKEPHYEKTCVCKEIKFIIVVDVFNVSCVYFKEIFSVHYGKWIQLTQNETSDKQENTVFCEYYLRQSPFKCTAQRNLFQISAEKVSFSFASKAIFYVFDLSRWTKTCIRTVVFGAALDVQSVKVTEYPFKENRSVLEKKTPIIYMFFHYPLNRFRKKKNAERQQKTF